MVGQSIPTVVLFDPVGEEAERLIGVPTMAELQRLVACGDTPSVVLEATWFQVASLLRGSPGSESSVWVNSPAPTAAVKRPKRPPAPCSSGGPAHAVVLATAESKHLIEPLDQTRHELLGIGDRTPVGRQTDIAGAHRT